MKLLSMKGISSLKQKSPLADVGIVFNAEKGEVFIFSYGSAEWLYRLTFEPETGDGIVRGSYFLDGDALKKITDVFNTSEPVFVSKKKNDLVFVQDQRTLSLSVKKFADAPFYPKNSPKKPLFMGKIAQAILDLTRIAVHQSSPNASDTVLILTKNTAFRTTLKIQAIVRDIAWDNFPGEPAIAVDCDLISSLKEPVLYYAPDCFKIVSDDIEVFFPNTSANIINPEMLQGLDSPLEILKKQPSKQIASFRVADLVQVAQLLNKLYSITSRTLKFVATSSGFMVSSNDMTSSFENHIVCDHEFFEDFTFFVDSTLLADLRHSSEESMYLRFAFRNEVPILGMFFADKELDVLSNNVVLISLQVAKTK